VLGESHSLMGGAAGGAAGEFVLHLPLAGTATLAGLTAGMVLLNDLDSCGASAARSLGFISGAVSHLIRFVSGGHRHGSHSIGGIAVFTVLAWAACHYRADVAGKAGLALLIAIAVSSGLEALHLAGSHLADVIAIGVAAAVIWLGFGLALIPLATGLGASVHVLGDMLTDAGRPLLLPFSKYRFKLWPEPFAFSTGTRPERLIVVPLLLVALAFLAFHEVSLSAGHATLAARGWRP
jgi:membrane-bound metal-dependent hydrolase YbcI (DUF457 family)